MRHTIFICLLFYIYSVPFNLMSQNSVDYNNYIQLNGFLYKYVPYQLTFPNSKDYNGLKIESNNLKLNKLDNDINKLILQFNVKNEGDVRLSVFDSISNRGIKLNMRGKVLPVTINYVNGNKRYISGAFINKDELTKNGFLTCSVINFDADIRYKIKKFDLIYCYNNKLKKFTSETPSLTIDQQNAIKNLKGKTIIIFDNIIIEEYNGEQMEIEPFVLFLN